MLRSPEPGCVSRLWFAWVAALIGTLLSLPSGTVLAEGDYEGMWETGPTRVSVSIRSWGEDCGKRPRSEIKPAGGRVRITQSGHRLIIHSRTRALRSDGCWSPNSALRRTSSSFLDGVWSTSCNTPPDDPKSEIGEYSLRLEGKDVLNYKDVSRYNWELKQSSCVATIVTTQKLTRVGSPAATKTKPESPPPSPVFEQEQKPEEACEPGPPARLLLLPKRAGIEPGRRICFRARVTDSAGCSVPGQSVQWSLQHSRGLRGFLRDGCFLAAESAAESEGEFRVVATASGLRSQAVVSVRPPDLSNLVAKRIEGGAVNGFERQERSEPGEEVEESATVGVEVGTGGGPSTTLVIFTVITVLGLVAVAVSFKLKRRPRPGIMKGSESEEELLTAASGQSAASFRPPALSAAAAGPSGQWICPKCRRGYPREKGVCATDGTALVPYEQFANQHRSRHKGSKTMQCPKCGEIYPANTTFCGKDGSPLKPIY